MLGSKLQSGAFVRPLISGKTDLEQAVVEEHNAEVQNQQLANQQVHREPQQTSTFLRHKRTIDEVEKDQDTELEILKSKVSLYDIVSKQRIRNCVKSTRCSHIEPFDFETFCCVNKVTTSFFSKPNMTETDNRWQLRSLPNENGKVRFQLSLKRGKSLSNMNHLKLTRKYKNVLNFRCPVCNVSFNSMELIHDDFMDLVLRNVPPDIKTVELDDSFVCTLLPETTEIKSDSQVISLDDGDDIAGDGLSTEITPDLVNGIVSDDDSPLKLLSRKSKRIRIKLFSDNDEYDFWDSDDGEDLIGGTEDDPVVID